MSADLKTPTTSLNSAGIKSLCLDIQVYVENVQKALYRIDDLLGESNAFYNDDTRNTVLTKNKNLRLSHNNIIKNMSSYIDDYNLVVRKFQTQDTSFTFNISFKE